MLYPVYKYTENMYNTIHLLNNNLLIKQYKYANSILRSLKPEYRKSKNQTRCLRQCLYVHALKLYGTRIHDFPFSHISQRSPQ